MDHHPHAPSWRSALLLAIGCLLPASCGPSAPAPTGQDERWSNIQNGSPTDGYPQVVSVRYLRYDRQPFDCTGSLIRPQTVMTDAHCVYNIQFPLEQPGPVSYGHFSPVPVSVTVGDEEIPICWTRVPRALEREYTSTRTDQDIALVGLCRSPRAGVAPLSIVFRAPVSGEPVILVGFGDDEFTAGEAPGAEIAAVPDRIKRQGPNVVEENTPEGSYFTLQHRPDDPEVIWADGCWGDSGGPVLDGSGQIIGNILMPREPRADTCTVGGKHMRLDRHEGFITDNAATVPANAVEELLPLRFCVRGAEEVLPWDFNTTMAIHDVTPGAPARLVERFEFVEIEDNHCTMRAVPSGRVERPAEYLVTVNGELVDGEVTGPLDSRYSFAQRRVTMALGSQTGMSLGANFHLEITPRP